MKYRILLVCALGYSTSMLKERMKKAAQTRGLQVEIEALAQTDLEELEQLGEVDALLLGPQIKHVQNRYADRFQIPVLVIAAADYGLMNGENVLEEIMVQLEGETK